MNTGLRLFQLGRLLYGEKQRADESNRRLLEKQKAVTYAVELAHYLPAYEQYTKIRGITESPNFREVYDFDQRNEIWKALRSIEQMIAESDFGNNGRSKCSCDHHKSL